jgi:hypothetical protein
MVTIGSLWLPILLSAVLVWIASALVWMVLPHHKNEFRGVSDEEALRRALGGLAPGWYRFPYAATREAWKSPEHRRKLEEGPVGFLTVLPRGVPSMKTSMALSFLYYVLVGIVVAYLAGRTLAPGTEYLAVFRVAGTAAWLAYGWAVFPEAIWFGRPWGSVAKHLADALLYALLTAGTFGWLWPR